MSPDAGSRLTATLTALDPSVVASAPAPVRAVGSFLLVLVFGGALLYLSEGFVDRAIDSSMESPLKSAVYGAVAYGSIAFAGVYAYSQLAAVGAAGPAVGAVGMVLVALVWLVLAGLGFAVVGARITEAAGERRLRLGLVVGAAVSAVAWLVPSFVLGLLAWVVVVSVGIGGPTRKWVHA